MRSFPLTAEQRRLWLLSCVPGMERAYNVSFQVSISGPVDVDRLRSSLRAVMDAHTSLRTSVRVDDKGQVLGVPVDPSDQAWLEETVVSDRSNHIVETARLRDSHQNHVFDLSASLPTLASVLVTPEGATVFLTIHHAFFDMWSFTLLVRGLIDAYQGRSLRPSAPGSGDRIESPVEVDLFYWQSHLAGAPGVSSPMASPLAMKPIAGSAAITRDTIAGITRHDVLAAAGRLRTTPNVLVLTAFARSCMTVSEQCDFIVGIPVATRGKLELDTIGFYANTLPLRFTATDGRPERLSVSSVGEQLKDALRHRSAPLDGIVSAAAPAEHRVYQPLVQTTFQWYRFQRTFLLDSETTAHVELLPRRTSQFDLSVDVEDDGHNLDIVAEFPDHEAGRRRVATLLDLFNEEIGNIAGGSHRAAQDASMRAPSAHDSVEMYAQLTPNAVALIDEDGEITYAELDKRINATRDSLLKAGLSSGFACAVELPLGVEQLVVMLACWRLEAVYVPIDALWPTHRKKAVMDRCRPAVTVATVDGWLTFAPREHPSEARRYNSETSYILHTSGSTGIPKSVLMTRPALRLRVETLTRRYGLTARDRSLLLSNPTFDVSLEEALTAWRVGATVVIGRRPHVPPPRQLIELMNRDRVTVVNLPAGLWHELVDYLGDQNGRWPSLCRLTITGSDVIERGRADTWWAIANVDNVLLAAYGTTETCITAVTGTVQRSWTSGSGALPLGVPLADAAVDVIGPDGESLPWGQAGELVVISEAVATGYLDDEQLTRSSFSTRGSARAYRTGDRVQWADGVLHFLGRIDREVKVGGERVDLRALESMVLNIDGVTSATADVTSVAGRTRPSLYVSWTATADEERQRVRLWAGVHDDGDLNSADEAEEAFSGWNSSFSREAIGRAQMHAWLDGIVARIVRLHPTDLLELGCGTGLITRRILPMLRSYTGTEIAFDALSRTAAGVPLDGRATFHLSAAHDWSWCLEESTFDTIVLNSVIQYFPSRAYLVDVLQHCWQRLRRGGHIVVGDIRDLSLAADFYEQLALRRSELSAEQLKDSESELLVSADLFRRVAVGLRDCQVAIMPKIHDGDNELTRYRYDVLLRKVDPTADTVNSAEWSELLSPADRDEYAIALTALHRPIVVRGVHDDRLSASAVYDRGDGLGRVDPSRLRRIGERLGVQLDVMRSKLGPSHLDIYLSPAGMPVSPPWEEPHEGDVDPSSPDANDPLAFEARLERIATIRRVLRESLPASHMPATIRLEAGTTSFIDGVAVSKAPDSLHQAAPPGFDGLGREVTATEKIVNATWASVIGNQPTALEQNFFATGGDSLLLIRLITRLAEAGVEISLADALADPTPGGIARMAEGAPSIRRSLDPAGPATAGDPSNSAWPTSSAAMFPLLPMQQWLINRAPRKVDAYAQPLVIRVEGRGAASVRRIVDGAIAHLPSLQTRFAPVGDHWTQTPPAEAEPVPWKIFRASDDDDMAIHALATDLLLAAGRTVSAGWRPTPDGAGGDLFIVCHHFVIDQVTWERLLDHLDTGTEDWPVQPSHRANITATGELATQYATSFPDTLIPIDGTYVLDCFGGNSGAVADRREQWCTVALPFDSDMPTQDTQAALLTTFGVAVAAATGYRRIIVDVECHGRDALTAASAATAPGWFTLIMPVHLDMDRNPMAACASQLARLAEVGPAYTMSSRPVTARSTAHTVFSSPTVCFNFAGSASKSRRLTRLRATVTERAARLVESPDDLLVYALEVNVTSDGERFRAQLSYDSTRVSQSQIATLQAMLEGRVDVAGQSSSTSSSDGSDQLSVLGHQSLMLARHQLLGSHDTNINHTVVRFQGPLKLEVLQSAWDLVLSRHEGLRVRFSSVPHGGYRQRFEAANIGGEIPTTYSQGDVSEQIERVKADHQSHLTSPSNISPMLHLIRVSPNDHRLIWTDHHAILDGWSTWVVLRDLMRAYRWTNTPPALRGDEPFEAPAPSLTRFLQQQLPSHPRVPQSNEVVAVPAVRLETVTLPWADVDRPLKALAQHHSVSVATVMLTIWSVIAGRLEPSGGSSAPTVGLSTSERSGAFPGLDELVGSIATIRSSPTIVRGPFADGLRAVRDNQIALARNADLFDMDLTGFTSTTVVVFQNHAAAADSLRAGALFIENIDSPLWTGAPLTLDVTPVAGGLIKLHFAVDLISAAWASDILKCLELCTLRLAEALSATGVQSDLHIEELDPELSNLPRLERRLYTQSTISGADPAKALCREVARLTGSASCSPKTSWAEVGLTSLQALQVATATSTLFKATVTIADVVTTVNIEELIRIAVDGGVEPSGDLARYTP